MSAPKTTPGPPAFTHEKQTIGVALDVPDELIDAIAERAAAIVLAAQNTPAAPRWLDTKSAADHLSCPPSRIHDLVALQKLTPRRDGRRLLFDRADLDAYVESSAT